MGSRSSKHNAGRKRRTFRDDGTCEDHGQIVSGHESDAVRLIKLERAEVRAGLRRDPTNLQDLLKSQRYSGEAFLSTNLRWTPSESTALDTLARAHCAIDSAAIILGRSSTSIVNRVRDYGLYLPPEWRSVGRKRAVTEKHVDLQFPYIVTKRPEHADILALNALVPRALPSHMRADIVQEMMLAVLEGTVSVDTLAAKAGKAKWFVAQFYKNNFEQGGHAVSLTATNEDGEEYDRLSIGISQDEWRTDQLREKRSAWDAIDNRFYAPTQIDDTYGYQVVNEQRRLHAEDKYLDWQEAADALDAVDPKSFRHIAQFDHHHGADRLKERYGITYSRTVNRELRGACQEGRVRIVRSVPEDDFAEGWVRCQGRNVRVAFNPTRGTLITVLPPEDKRPTHREKVLAAAEKVFARQP